MVIPSDIPAEKSAYSTPDSPDSPFLWALYEKIFTPLIAKQFFGADFISKTDRYVSRLP